jgi:transposase-like protein
MGNRPRQFTAEFKAKAVLDVLINGKSLSQASREYGVKDSVLSRWRQEFLDRAVQVFELRAGVDQRDVRIAELERVVGRLTMELEMAKKASHWLGTASNGSARS